MAPYTTIPLSSATTSGNSPITVNAGAWVTVHATDTSSTVQDEIWLYAYNPNATAIDMSVRVNQTVIGFSTTMARYSIPAYGTLLVVPGIPFSGAYGGTVTIQCYALTGANPVHVYGYVNRIS